MEDRERIFERFARGQGAARRSLPGAGLGLAIVAETADPARRRGLVRRRPGRRGAVLPLAAGGGRVTVPCRAAWPPSARWRCSR